MKLKQNIVFIFYLDRNLNDLVFLFILEQAVVQLQTNITWLWNSFDEPDDSGESECYLLLFYKTGCAFSMNAAPHFNGLARLFPDLNLIAIDANQYDK